MRKTLLVGLLAAIFGSPSQANAGVFDPPLCTDARSARPSLCLLCLSASPAGPAFDYYLFPGLDQGFPPCCGPGSIWIYRSVDWVNQPVVKEKVVYVPASPAPAVSGLVSAVVAFAYRDQKRQCEPGMVSSDECYALLWNADKKPEASPREWAAVAERCKSGCQSVSLLRPFLTDEVLTRAARSAEQEPRAKLSGFMTGLTIMFAATCAAFSIGLLIFGALRYAMRRRIGS